MVLTGKAWSKFDYEKMFLYEDQYKDKTIVGIDEVGVGTLVGDLYACACIVDLEKARKFSVQSNSKLLRPYDSKQFSEKERELMFTNLSEIVTKYSIGKVTIEELKQGTLHTGTAGMLARRRAYEGLGVQADIILIDHFKMPEEQQAKVIGITKGDQKSVSIACASILAKVLRDWYMKELDKKYPMYFWRENKGYYNKKHLEGMKTHGLCEYHRTNFFDMQRILERAKQV